MTSPNSAAVLDIINVIHHGFVDQAFGSVQRHARHTVLSGGI